MVAAAAIGSGVAGLAGSAISSGAAGSAASTQADAANQAAQLQNQQFQQTQTNLAPFLGTGQGANAILGAQLGNYSAVPNDEVTNLQKALPSESTMPSMMTESQLVQTPGYQFNLGQGLQSVQNSAAARGLGLSGAAMKGAANYATGLADSTYQNQFANQQALFGNQPTLADRC